MSQHFDNAQKPKPKPQEEVKAEPVPAPPKKGITKLNYTQEE